MNICVLQINLVNSELIRRSLSLHFVKVLFLLKDYTLSLRAVEQSDYELPDTSDLLTTYIPRQLPDLRAYSPSSPHKQLDFSRMTEQTCCLSFMRALPTITIKRPVMRLTVCGIHAKSWISVLFSQCVLCPSCTLSSGKNVFVPVAHSEHRVLTRDALGSGFVLLIWRRWRICP